jgi:hypothetical protein
VVTKRLRNVVRERPVDGLGLFKFDLWGLASTLDRPRLGGECFAEMEWERTGSWKGGQGLFSRNNDLAARDNIFLGRQIAIDASNDAVFSTTFYFCRPGQKVLEAFDGVFRALRNFSEARAIFSGGRLGGGGSGVGEGLAEETPARILRHHVLEVLRELGGRAKVGEIFDAMECRLGAGLLAGDVRPDAQGVTTWRRNVGMLRYELVAEGVLREGRPEGVWELSGKAKG